MFTTSRYVKQQTHPEDARSLQLSPCCAGKGLTPPVPMAGRQAGAEGSCWESCPPMGSKLQNDVPPGPNQVWLRLCPLLMHLWCLPVSQRCIQISGHVSVQKTRFSCAPQVYHEIIWDKYEFLRFLIGFCGSFLILLAQYFLYIWSSGPKIILQFSLKYLLVESLWTLLC